jgi:hypothetical protein
MKPRTASAVLLMLKLVLAPLFFFDLLILGRFAGAFVRNGFAGIHGWIVHIAVIGSTWEQMFDPAYQAARVREVYLSIVLVFVLTGVLVALHEIIRRKSKQVTHALAN